MYSAHAYIHMIYTYLVAGCRTTPDSGSKSGISNQVADAYQITSQEGVTADLLGGLGQRKRSPMKKKERYGQPELRL